MSRPVIAAALATAAFSAIAQGQTFSPSWTGPASGLYGTAANWSGGVVPANNVILGDFYNVTINRVGGAAVTMNADPAILNLTIGSNAGNTLLMGDTRQLSLIGANGGGAISLSNAGTLSVGSTVAAAATLNLNGTSANISGVGTIIMLGDSVMTGVGTVTSSNNIVGTGNLGNNAIALINNGTITASGGNLTVDPRLLGGLDNNSLMQAVSGGTLILSGNGGGVFSNAGGTISVAANGRINLVDGAAIVGGTIQTAGLNTSIFFVPGGGSATLNGVTSTADVNVGINSTLNLFGGITNNSRIRTNNSVGVATYNLGSSTVSLNGTGSLLLNQISGSIGNIVGTGTMVNGASHQIVGAGSIGDDTMVIRNNGLIRSGGVGTLTIDPTDVGTGFFNAGTLQSNAGLLMLNPATYSNTGTIEAVGQLFLQSVTINGGTLQTGSSGSISKVSGATATWNNVYLNNQNTVASLTGTLTVASSTFDNSGTVAISANTVDSILVISSGTLALDGPGTGVFGLVTGGAGAPRLGGTGTFHNINNVVRGEGFLGLDQAKIVNQGVIQADVAGKTLAVDQGTGALINAGTLAAINGGTIDLLGSPTINNSGGTIRADGVNSVVLLSNGTLTGGTFASSGGGTIRLTTGTSPVIKTMANTGQIVIEGNRRLKAEDVFTNTGVIAITPGPNSGTFETAFGSTVHNDGTIILDDVNGVSSIPTLLGGGVLNNNGTIRGDGQIIAAASAGTFTINNIGSIISDDRGLTLGALLGTAPPLVAVNNTGLIRITAGAGAGEFGANARVVGTGTIVVDAAGTLSSFSTVATPSVTLNGQMLQAGNIGTLGNVAGSGTLVIGTPVFTSVVPGDVRVNHARIAGLHILAGTLTTLAGGGTLGTSLIEGTLTIGNAGPGRWDLTNHDLVIDYAGGSPLTTIRGYIIAGRSGGTWTGDGLTSSSAATSGASKTALAIAEATDLFTSFPQTFSGQGVDATTLVIKYTLEGDANLSGAVDLDDFTILASNFGSSSKWTRGDFDYDGVTNLNDFTALAANFGQSLPADLPRGSSVPEPGTTIVSLTGVVGLLAARRRRRNNAG